MIAALMALAAALSGGSVGMGSDAAIKAALSKCLNSSSATSPASTEADRVPPGLIGGKMVSVQPIVGTGGDAFSYEGTRPRVISCGIALYGPVDRSLRDSLVSVINNSGKGTPTSNKAYDLTKDFPDAVETYWGIGLTGVVMLSREPSISAPTIEIEYHSILVQ